MGIDVLRMHLLNPNLNDEQFVAAALNFFYADTDINAIEQVPSLLPDEERIPLYNFLVEDYKKQIKSTRVRELMKNGDPNGEIEQSTMAGERLKLANRNVKGYLALKSGDEQLISEAKMNGSIDKIYIHMMQIHEENKNWQPKDRITEPQEKNSENKEIF